jgi:dihydrofolate reductase
MKISLIVAMSSNRVIGHQNRMPWHLSADLKRFKALTRSSPVLMGRKTFESIGKPLIERTNIILSQNTHYAPAGCFVFQTLENAMAFAAQCGEELFVIGGAALYQMTLPMAERLYLTDIQAEFEGDTFFPALDLADWHEIACEDIAQDPSVSFSYRFLTLEKKR